MNNSSIVLLLCMLALPWSNINAADIIYLSPIKSVICCFYIFVKERRILQSAMISISPSVRISGILASLMKLQLKTLSPMMIQN